MRLSHTRSREKLEKITRTRVNPRLMLLPLPKKSDKPNKLCPKTGACSTGQSYFSIFRQVPTAWGLADRVRHVGPCWAVCDLGAPANGGHRTQHGANVGRRGRIRCVPHPAYSVNWSSPQPAVPAEPISLRSKSACVHACARTCVCLPIRFRKVRRVVASASLPIS